LTGNIGIDTLTGGAGNDSFVYNGTLDFGDRITDFANAAGNDDRFLISRAVGGGLTAGTLAASAFVSGTGNVALDADDRFIYNTTTGNLFFDADGTAATAAVLVATLTTRPVLTNADIVIF
jgi:Ca2+-binding RTX toxin-like protein